MGKPVVLREWQRDIIRGIYDSPTRRAIVSFGRKNGKTGLSAFLLLLHLCGPEARRNSQLFSAAQSREQAAILFALAAKVVRMSPDLSAIAVVRDTAKQLACPELGTLYRALSAEASTAYGLSPVFTVHDELGQVVGPRSELYEALETAAAANDAPLSVIISTQAPTDADLLSLLIDDAAAHPEGKTKLFLYTADVTMDPFGVATIKAANPAFGDFQNAEEVLTQADEARRLPAREAAYRNLILNQRINQANPFIPRTLWERAARPVEDSVFARNPVWIGLDLSQRNDLTALVMVAQDEDSVWHLRAEFFAPEVGVRDRAHRDRTPYDLWAQQGFITLTPGASVEYSWVAARLVQICSTCNVQEIAFDRWRIEFLKAELARLGAELPLHPFGQGFKDMSPAVEQFEGELLNDRIIHGGNPVLTNHAANAVVIRDPAGARKLDKSKATGRIDGLVAAVMAIARAASMIGEGSFDDFIRNPVRA